MSLSSELVHKVTFYSCEEIKNDMGQIVPGYRKEKTVWAEIKKANESMKNAAAGTEYALFTHKITIRRGAVTVRSDMRVEYEGMMYDVLYAEPCFMDKAKQIIYARAIVE